MSNLIQQLNKCARQLGKTIYTTQALQDIYKMYLDDGGKPYVTQYRKGWESQRAYDLKNERAHSAPVTPPDVSSLPAKRWVKPRVFKGDIDYHMEQHDLREAWLKEQKAKYQSCHVLIDNKPTDVFLFKKERDALMFKLAWG